MPDGGHVAAAACAVGTEGHRADRTLCASDVFAPSATPVSGNTGWVARLFGFYRAGISPLLGPSCRYEPSCSHYAEQAIAEWGFARGVALGIWRILRCHPFATGGLDPVPSKNVRLVEPARGNADW